MRHNLINCPVLIVFSNIYLALLGSIFNKITSTATAIDAKWWLKGTSAGTIWWTSPNGKIKKDSRFGFIMILSLWSDRLLVPILLQRQVIKLLNMNLVLVQVRIQTVFKFRWGQTIPVPDHNQMVNQCICFLIYFILIVPRITLHNQPVPHNQPFRPGQPIRTRPRHIVQTHRPKVILFKIYANFFTNNS